MLDTQWNRTLKIIYCTCLLSFHQFIIGCSFIFSSFLLAELRQPTSTIKIDNDDASWIASVPILVCPVGLLILGILTDKIGKRKTLQTAYVLIIISWAVLAFAESLRSIIIGRLIIGIVYGSVTYVYLYLGEICPTKYRPLCFSITTIFVGVGMVCECILAMFFHWQTVAFMLFALSSTCFLALFSLPEPPVWLRANGRISDAEKAEEWFGMDPPATTTAVAGTANGSNGPGQLDGGSAAGTKPSYCSQFFEPTVWKPALITMSFFVFQQGCGFYVLMLYSMDVLRDFQVQLDGVTVTLFMSISRVVGSLLFSSLHEVNRKKLVVISGSGMTVSLVAVIVYMKTYKDVVDPPYALFPVIAFVTYMFSALLGMLPLPWAICGELFPISVKGVMGGIVQIFGYEIMFSINKIYPSLVATYGIENIWAVFAGFCLASVFYGIFIMPETKGKSLDEILNSFDSRKKSIKNNLP